MPHLTFELDTVGIAAGPRRGRLLFARGIVETPAFMPVGTQATVKTLEPHEVETLGAQIVLSNTYHLMLRPGVDLIRQAGGLHEFMRWSRPILTDSGGFQVFSLASQVRVRDEGVTFRSHLDGSAWFLTPEEAVRLQTGYGSDIMMALDHVVGLPSTRRKVAEAAKRTHEWLQRCVAAHQQLADASPVGALFGIAQGGLEEDLRRESAQVIAAADVAGCAIGGLSVGETKEAMNAMLEVTTPHLPVEKPRYLMGVGSPEDLWNGVARGVDMFDCVLPTRLARNAALFTPDGRVNIRNRRFAQLHEPLDSTCDCHTCRTYSAAYLHHLYRAEELLALKLGSIHNLRFLARQMETMRGAIEAGSFSEAHVLFNERYRPVVRQIAA